MAKQRVFISFGYDNDEDLKILLVGQAKNENSPFEIADWSIKGPSADWKKKARERIKRSDQVVVMCGEHTDTASGVSGDSDSDYSGRGQAVLPPGGTCQQDV